MERKKNILLFVRKTRVEAIKFIQNSLKKIRFFNLNLPSTTIMFYMTFFLAKLENK